MIKAIFFDLDETLLSVDTQAFVRAYVQELAAYMLARYPQLATAPTPLLVAMQRATGMALSNLDPTRTNTEVTLEALTTLTGLDWFAARKGVEDFYNGPYLQLEQQTRPVEGARALVEKLNSMGIAVVIATNPVFPLNAVMQRLAWAGLDSPSRPYTFISNADELHYTKPNSHFYEELMARVGVEADEAIMVGDNFDDDIVPAAAAGLGTFWISEGHNAKPSAAPSPSPVEMQPDGSGTLADFARLVDEGWLSVPKDRPRTVSQVAPRMLGNVAALFGLAETAKMEYWDMRPDPNEWSPLEIVCHLRDSERLIQRPRLQRIATEDNPFISEPVPPPGPRERDLSREDAHTALRQFWNERCATLEFLMTLRLEQWQAPARHSVFGPTTLLEMAHFSARHDHLHINQLCQTLGRCKQEVRAR